MYSGLFLALTSRIILGGAHGTIRMPEIKPELDTCKASLLLLSYSSVLE